MLWNPCAGSCEVYSSLNDFAIKLIEIDFENTMIEEEIWIIMA